MKNIFLILFLCGSIAFGQTANSDKIVFTSYGMAKTIYSTDALNLNEIKGSLFLTDTYQKGKIIDTEKNTQKEALIRYNVFHDMMEVKVENANKVVVLSRLNNIEYEINEEKFFFATLKTKDGEEIERYFNDLYSNNGIRFMAIYEPDYIAPKKATTGYTSDKPAEFSFNKKYFIQMNKGYLLELKLKGKALNDIFRGEKANSYLQKNRIKSEKEVIDFLKFYTH